MKIYFGKYPGLDTSEIPSGYLVWIMEEYDKCDLPLREACKKELSHRLSLDFSSHIERDLYAHMKEVQRLHNRVAHLESLLCMCSFWGIRRYIIEKYINNPQLLNSDIKLISQANQPIKTVSHEQRD